MNIGRVKVGAMYINYYTIDKVGGFLKVLSVSKATHEIEVIVFPEEVKGMFIGKNIVGCFQPETLNL